MTRVFIVSNRVATPRRKGDQAAGGLEVAVRATLKRHPGIWFGWSGSVVEPNKFETRIIENDGLTLAVTDLSREDYNEYYSGFANRVLWPILHYRLDLAEFNRRELTGYLRVNTRLAYELHKMLQPDDIVWVHDYHLIPFAKMLRELGHKNRIGFFLHVPMPPPEILTALPNYEHLIPSLREYDLVGFQTEGDAANCARFLEQECGVDVQDIGRSGVGSRRMRTGAFPVGIDALEFRGRAERAMDMTYVKEVIRSLPGLLIIGVDRLDYSKGLKPRFDAYEYFLRMHAQWHRKVTFLQIAPKSRSQIPEYVQIRNELETTAGRINGGFSDARWTPIRYVNRTHSRTELAGLYRAARVGLVTPTRDGMNLVAKEYVAAQNPEDPGVLILSKFAGAASELDAALLINPYDPEAVGHAISRALEMSLDERRVRHEKLFAAVKKNSISNWGECFLRALTGRKPPVYPAMPQSGETGFPGAREVRRAAR